MCIHRIQVLAVGRGHSGIINAAKISPDLRSVVSVGSTGEIIFWELPSFNNGGTGGSGGGGPRK